MVQTGTRQIQGPQNQYDGGVRREVGKEAVDGHRGARGQLMQAIRLNAEYSGSN